MLCICCDSCVSRGGHVTQNMLAGAGRGEGSAPQSLHAAEDEKVQGTT